MEQRKSHINEKGNAQAGERPVRQNTDVMCDGGLSRSSEEASVMGVERRAEVVQLELDFTTLGNQGMTKPILTKGIPITKQMVYEAYKKVKRNKGAAGIDNESLDDFDRNLARKLYKIWNRMSSGSYFPMGVREVSIPKADGKKRKLGIPTVSDRIAQEVVRTYIEPRLEKEFSDNSYGYRPFKNTHQALTAVRKNRNMHG